MRLIKQKTNINFLGETRRKIALGISVLVVVVSLYELAVEGLEQNEKFLLSGSGKDLVQFCFRQHCNDEQNATGAVGTCLEYLIRVNEEVLAHDGAG